MRSHSYDPLPRLPLRVPEALAARAEAWRPDEHPAPAVPAASVVLLRDGADGLETYLLHRHARMAFAASMVVFPGGKVDPADEEPGAEPSRRCAVRETHEETGVLLEESSLRPWAHWVTPEPEPRRYDTFFFVAALPDGAEAEDLSGETDSAEWSTPGGALEAARLGRIGLMPPTRSVLLELAELGDVAAVLERAADRTVQTVLPGLVRHRDGWRFAYPEGPQGGEDR